MDKPGRVLNIYLHAYITSYSPLKLYWLRALQLQQNLLFLKITPKTCKRIDNHGVTISSKLNNILAQTLDFNLKCQPCGNFAIKEFPSK